MMFRPDGWTNPYVVINPELHKLINAEKVGSPQRHHYCEELYANCHGQTAFEAGADAMLDRLRRSMLYELRTKGVIHYPVKCVAEGFGKGVLVFIPDE